MTAPVWNTNAGLIGVYPSSTALSVQLSATAQLPATSVTYTFLSGELPAGISINEYGLISGIAPVMSTDGTYTFAIRATDNLGELRDRTFSMTISGVAAPEFITPSGGILTTYDSTWISLPIQYSNPVPENPVRIRVIQGVLPPGLEINRAGLIRGYADPPTTLVNLGLITTSATVTTAANIITCFSTTGFSPNRPVIFSGTTFGNINTSQTYYIKEILNANSFTISTTQGGPVYSLTNATGFMTVTLPNIAIGQPSIRTFSFVLQLESPLGNDLQSYYITVINQNTPVSQGGPGIPANSRVPTIYNTRPPTYDIQDSLDYSYYLLPPASEYGEGGTYPIDPSNPVPAYMGKYIYDNYFSFRVLGHDFDGNELEYQYANLPAGLTGNTETGWITGNPIIGEESISNFTFSVRARKAGTSGTTFATPEVYFYFTLTRDVDGTIVWNTDSDLGDIYRGVVSVKSVRASSDVQLLYRLAEISTTVTRTTDLNVLTCTSTEGFSPGRAIVFTGLTFGGLFANENYYVKRVINQTSFTISQTEDGPELALTNGLGSMTASLVNTESNTLPPNLTLLDNGEITGYVAYQTLPYISDLDRTVFTFAIEAYSPIYSIVRSIKTFRISVLKEFNEPSDTLYIKATPSLEDRQLIRSLLEGPESEALMPTEYLYRPSDLNFGKATNVTYVHAYGIYASNLDQYVAAITRNHYWRNITLGPLETAIAKNSAGEVIYEVVYSKIIDNLINPEGISIPEEIVWPRLINLQEGPWYTSVTDVYTSYIYENPLPTFYTSLTPGYVRTLYPNSLPDMRLRVGQVLGQEFNSNLLPAWMTSQQENGSTLGFTPAWVICYTKPGYSAIIKNNIENNWVNFLGRPNKLNKINFQIDRFTVNKSLTYDYDDLLTPAAWTGLPSATPPPNPIDSKDFYVLFPRKTILPKETEY